MSDFKFKIGDAVYFKENPKESLTVISRSNGRHKIWYTLSDGVPYSQDQLVASEDKLKVEVFYRVDGMEFDTLEEAREHRKRVQLFYLLNEGLDEDVGFVLLEHLLDPILNNAEKIKEILN